MKILDAVKLVRVVKLKGKQYAMVDFNEWETLVERIEDIEDIETMKAAYAELAKAGGDRRKAGWKTLEEFEKELKSERLSSGNIAASSKRNKKPARPRSKSRLANGAHVEK